MTVKICCGGVCTVCYEDGTEANGGLEKDAVENTQTSGSHSAFHEPKGPATSSQGMRRYISVMRIINLAYF
jgi:hypothetical protein